MECATRAKLLLNFIVENLRNWQNFWTTVTLEKLVVCHTIKNFSSFQKIRMLITVFTRTRYNTSSRFILILPSPLWRYLPSRILPFRFAAKLLYPAMGSPMQVAQSRASHQLPWNDRPNVAVCGEECIYYKGARGSVVGWDTMLQRGRSWFRFPVTSMDFFKCT
jgi:hypothetical protein